MDSLTAAKSTLLNRDVFEVLVKRACESQCDAPHLTGANATIRLARSKLISISRRIFKCRPTLMEPTVVSLVDRARFRILKTLAETERKGTYQVYDVRTGLVVVLCVIRLK